MHTTNGVLMPAPGFTSLAIKDDLAKAVDRYIKRNKEGLSSRADVVSAALRLYLGMTPDVLNAEAIVKAQADFMFRQLTHLQAILPPTDPSRELIDKWILLVQPSGDAQGAELDSKQAARRVKAAEALRRRASL